MNRKQKIADAAQQLFAERGYESTPTLLIARQAGVSEALIFKHFGSKDQLLEYVIKNGYKRIVEHNRGLLQVSDPLQFILRMIDLPHKLVGEEPLFWEMQYRLVDLPVSMKHHERFLQPVHSLLVKAFTDLGYADAEQETQLALLLIDALWKREIVRRGADTEALTAFIKARYSARVPERMPD